jgi:hypothetical protein
MARRRFTHRFFLVQAGGDDFQSVGITEQAEDVCQFL